MMLVVSLEGGLEQVLLGAELDPGARRHVDAYLSRLDAAFRNALENARRAGEIDPEVDLAELAAFFAMSLIGVAAIIRAEAAPALVHSACRVVTSVLDCRGRAPLLPAD